MGIYGAEKRVWSNFDWPVLVSMLLLSLIGVALLYSAGYDPETRGSVQMERQFSAIGVGLLIFIFTAAINTSVWRRWSIFIYVVGCAALIAILFTGVVAGGARRWLEIGGFRAQPSEFMKVGIVLILARLFSSEDAPSGEYDLKAMIRVGVVAGIPVALTLVQPDLGTALCQLLIIGTMFLIAGLKRRTLFVLLLLAAGAIGAAYVDVMYRWPGIFHDYQRERVKVFMNPEGDLQGDGWQAQQSKIAVGSGEFLGKGFLKGTQTQLRFLPEQTTDFIFSVLAEEWGFVGSVVVVSLYGFLILHAAAIAAKSKDRFSSFLAVGVSAYIFWHVFINIGMATGFLPVVGLTLPFLSYGGSSVVSFMAALGLLTGASMRRYIFT